MDIRAVVVRSLRHSTRRFRVERMRLFRRAMRPRGHETILDVGGSPQEWLGLGYELTPITFLNQYPPSRFESMRAMFPDAWNYVQGDGRALQFSDHEFDIVFSNAVLEHVGDWGDQQSFAR